MFEFVTDLWNFFKQRKKFWLLPLMIAMLFLGALVIFSQNTVVAPFIYTFF